jgi:hypothetical protein
MPNRRLGKCPTCRRPLDEATRLGMGLRNGEMLNSLCPGRNGPSDIDHVLHNRWVSPERVMFLEYKNGVALTQGQQYLRTALNGDWEERNTGRLLAVRYHVLDQHDMQAAHHHLPLVVSFVWPVEASSQVRSVI